ncbi:MAG: 30S ribosome-binding factor RbfA [Fidelibacterota bacterium]
MKSFRPYKRTDRVANEILHILGSIQTESIDLSHLGFITFTQVEVSTDIRNAKVYFSVVKPKQNQKSIVHEMNRLGKKFRKYLGQELRTKFTPELKFIFDDTYEYTQKLVVLFREISHSSSETED